MSCFPASTIDPDDLFEDTAVFKLCPLLETLQWLNTDPGMNAQVHNMASKAFRDLPSLQPCLCPESLQSGSVFTFVSSNNQLCTFITQGLETHCSCLEAPFLTTPTSCSHINFHLPFLSWLTCNIYILFKSLWFSFMFPSLVTVIQYSLIAFYILITEDEDNGLFLVPAFRSLQSSREGEAFICLLRWI